MSGWRPALRERREKGWVGSVGWCCFLSRQLVTGVEPHWFLWHLCVFLSVQTFKRMCGWMMSTSNFTPLPKSIQTLLITFCCSNLKTYLGYWIKHGTEHERNFCWDKICPCSITLRRITGVPGAYPSYFRVKLGSTLDRGPVHCRLSKILYII